MKGFAVLSRAKDEAVKEKHPILSKMWGAPKIMGPYRDAEFNFGNITGGKISIPPGFEKNKLKSAQRFGMRNYGHVLSRDFDFNYSPFFYHSSLIRALDFYTVSLGCDLRLSEVVIADAAEYEGRNAFRLLLPIARRILLVTDRKKELLEEVDYAMLRYGTSVALIEDAAKAAERADIIVIASNNIHHKYLVNIERPTLYIKFPTSPLGNLWFDNISISFNSGDELDCIFAQGYVDVINKRSHWYNAEKEGFNIKSIKKGNVKIIER